MFKMRRNHNNPGQELFRRARQTRGYIRLEGYDRRGHLPGAQIMTGDQVDGRDICLHCAALPKFCTTTVASSPASVCRLKRPPQCPIDFCIWCGLWPSNGGLRVAENMAKLIMQPDNPVTYYWYKRTMWQVADRMGFLTRDRARKARRASNAKNNHSTDAKK